MQQSRIRTLAFLLPLALALSACDSSSVAPIVIDAASIHSVSLSFSASPDSQITVGIDRNGLISVASPIVIAPDYGRLSAPTDATWVGARLFDSKGAQIYPAPDLELRVTPANALLL